MASRVTIFRIAAVIILLLTGADLIACEIGSPANCEVSGAPCDQGPNSGDACLCCCFHIVVETPIFFEPTGASVPLDAVPQILLASVESPRIYHPPER